jgi:polyphosphate kinase
LDDRGEIWIPTPEWCDTPSHEQKFAALRIEYGIRFSTSCAFDFGEPLRMTREFSKGTTAAIPTGIEAAPASVNGSSYAPGAYTEGGVDLRAPWLYINRELSWLEFNARILAEADSDEVPLFERLKFQAIFTSNLDEFFMVRVAGLKQQLTGEVDEASPDGLSAQEQLTRISRRVRELLHDQANAIEKRLLPALRAQGFELLKPDALGVEALVALDERFHNEVFPILTPMAIDPGHPFPQVRNKSLNLGVMFQRDGSNEPGFGVVQVPQMLPRLVEAPHLEGGRQTFVLLEDLIARHVGSIFPGVKLRGIYTFRVTRNFDLEIDEEEAEDLLQEIQQELRRRERGNAVRLEVSGEPTPASLAKLVHALKLDPDRDVYVSSTVLNVPDLMPMVPKEGRKDLRDEPASPLVVPPLRDVDDLFAVIREQDVLFHHPYESFDPFIELISRAADDPDVLAIKQTLYRTGGDSPIIRALMRAAEAGKQVTAIVELKARFDEASNIQWARALEQSGVQVVYGVLGLKTHAKCLLVVRREGDRLRRYAHLSTGNYNAATSRHYTDVGLLTCRTGICEDVSALFNLLTGYSAPHRWNSLIVAPLGLHEAVLGLIAREADHARAGRPSKIVAKMNALVDEDVIEALYRASQAGVPITLLVRGISCLRPGIAGVSETIEVRAILDRYLEHARLFHFHNAGKDEVYLSSADWMPRNFHRRVEVMTPVEDASLRMRLIEMLEMSTKDNVKSWLLRDDGSYSKAAPKPGDPLRRSQQKFIEIARDRVKLADQAARPRNRLKMSPTSPKSPLEGKVPRTSRRRGRKGETEPNDS